MNISGLSVKRPVTTVMFILIVVLIGTVSLTRIPIDLYPNIEIPVAIVQTTYSNVSPEEIENLVTRPIEEVVGTVSNIDTIQSITSEGTSIVVIQFNYGTNMDFATLDIREKIDMVKSFLPDGASDPSVLQIDINQTAVVESTLSGADVATLYEYADSVVRPAIERIEGVASVTISGGYEDYVSVKLDTVKLNSYGLTFDQIASVLAAENINLPAGTVKKGDREFLLRAVGQFESINDIRKTPITLPTGAVIRLEDVADISITNEELTSITKVNGEPAVSISVQKQSGTNTVQVAAGITSVIEKLDNETAYDLNVVLDQSDFINRSISQVASSAIIGGILAVIVLLIFLRSFRSTIIIGLSMPISIIATGILLYFNNITLNMMTLGGLTLGIGMLVDNSVVVLENIYRFVQEGYEKKEAAIKGAKEVAMAVTASTLTTVAVFLPMVFVEGITSIMFRELSLTVTFSLLSSLIVSLTLIPMMASKLLVVDEFQGKHHENKFRIISWVLDKADQGFKAVDERYRKMLEWALNHRKTVVFSALAIFIVAVFSLTGIGSEFMPTTDEGSFVVNVELEDGAKTAETQAAMDEIVNRIIDIEEIDYIYTSTRGGSILASSSNEGTINGMLYNKDLRERSVFEVIEDVQKLISDIPGVEATVSSQSVSGSMMGGGSAVTIKLQGKNLDVLETWANKMVSDIKMVEGTRNVASNLNSASPQMEIYLDRNNASRFGLTTYQVSSQVKSMLDGKVATTYKKDGTELDVILEGDSRYNESIGNLNQLEITAPSGIKVPLGLIADIKEDTGAVTINREDLTRTVTITSDAYERDSASIVQDIQAIIDEYDMPNGYDVEFGGTNQEMIESFQDLGLALILAVILVYMIIAAQFESFLQPFIIMFSVPVAFAGGLLALFITNRTLNITSIIGFILLSGIVVNNAIVLLDYIGTRRKMGEDRSTAILKAGPTRLRPILMTSLTTILALVPMSLGLGEGAELQAGMGTVVIGGLLVSSFLTLLLIPVVYSIFDDRHNKFMQKRQEKKMKKLQA